MRVLCVYNTGEDLLFLGRDYNQHTIYNVEIDKLYNVYGISLWKDGSIHYLIQGSERVCSWYPKELFQIVDHSIPVNWYFNSLEEGSFYIEIWGYKELALDLNHYINLLEREAKDEDIFFSRKLEMDIEIRFKQMMKQIQGLPSHDLRLVYEFILYGEFQLAIDHFIDALNKENISISSSVYKEIKDVAKELKLGSLEPVRLVSN